jgi:[acyl-carrier-protein] S-malonyltransferase
MATKTAYLFPGQGAQYVGMGRGVYEQHAPARERYNAADDLLEFSLTDKMFGASSGEDSEPTDAEEAALTATDVAQPALYTHSLALMAVLGENDHAPDMAAGHSLGEYSALAATGAFSFEDGLRLVRRRGELMAEAGDREPGTMAAVIGMDDDAIEQVCRDVSAEGVGPVQAANYNAPGQVVISGSREAIERAIEQASDEGARRVIPLDVSGAFHSPLMSYARDGLAEALEDVTIREPRCPVYANVTAQPTTDPDEIRARLLEQLLAPVRWAQSVAEMQADGADRYVEVGAGRVLSGLARRTMGRSAELDNLDTAEDLAAWTADG